MHFQATATLLGVAALASALPRHPGHRKIFTTVSGSSTVVICQDCATVYDTAYTTVEATVFATDTSDNTPTATTSIVATTQSSAAADSSSALTRSVSIESASSSSSDISVHSSSASSSLATVQSLSTSSPVTISTSVAVPTSSSAPTTSTAQPATSLSTSTSSSSATSAVTSSTAPTATSSSTTSSSIAKSVIISSTIASSSVATSAPTSGAAAAAAATGGSSLKSKRGAVTNPFPGVTAPFAQYEKISWDMNWWEGAPDDQPANWQFVPQLTHFDPDQWWKGSDFFKNPSKYPYIASFLEPNVDSLSIDDAVKSWKTNLEPLTSSHTVLPPMIGQNGLDWLQKFITACSGCTLNKGPVAFTVYVSTDDAGVSDFKNHVTIMENAFPGRELWVANMGVLGTAADDKAEWLMRQLIPFLEGRASVTRYAWNGDASFWNNSTKTLTDLAKTYATL